MVDADDLQIGDRLPDVLRRAFFARVCHTEEPVLSEEVVGSHEEVGREPHFVIVDPDADNRPLGFF